MNQILSPKEKFEQKLTEMIEYYRTRLEVFENFGFKQLSNLLELYPSLAVSGIYLTEDLDLLVEYRFPDIHSSHPPVVKLSFNTDSVYWELYDVMSSPYCIFGTILIGDEDGLEVLQDTEFLSAIDETIREYGLELGKEF